MTVQSTTRRAGPFNGNGVTTQFPFDFKIFQPGDIRVIRTTQVGFEETLTLDSEYSVSLNLDQDADPGGTVTYPASGGALSLPSGWKLTVIGSIPNNQVTDLTNVGRFNPDVIERTLDRNVAQIQQLAERMDRSVQIPVSSTSTPEKLIDDLVNAGAIALNAAEEAAASAAAAAASAAELDNFFNFGAAGYQVQKNHTIVDPDGNRFTARGVQMFDYLFCSFENRANQNYRTIYSPPGKGPAFGISEPTYYAPTQYKSAAFVEEQIKLVRNTGGNLIRVGVEPAVMFAKVAYVDPSDGNTYPSDPDMLDSIIGLADKYGMVVQLQMSNDSASNADVIAFLSWLMARYYKKPHVWINPANEPLGAVNGGANVNNPTMWLARVKPLVQALRADVSGQPAGTKFVNPVAVDPPGWAERIDLVTSVLSSDPVFTGDPNLLINVHYYPLMGENDFRGVSGRLAQAQSRWLNYTSTYCVMVGEVGIDNFAGRYDPNLDPGVPSVDLAQWAKMQNAVADFLSYCTQLVPYTTLNGVIGHMWLAYIPGLARHDDNSMRRIDGTWTQWGTIYRDFYMQPDTSVLSARRALGADFATGAWSTGDLVNNAVNNAKLADMTPGRIKGRLTGGIGDPEDLNSQEVLAILTSLTAPVSGGLIGQPTFQAEGATGVRSAAVFVQQGVSDAYIGFYNRTTGAVTGLVSGNGSTGTVYGTSSDARLKTNIQNVEDGAALAALMQLRPVMAGWKSDPTAAREMMFLAHELEEVMPTAVSGERDKMVEMNGEMVISAQCVDYGRLTPLLAAALQCVVRRVASLEDRLAVVEAADAP